MTITLQLGNSDNRLSQQEWSEFVALVDKCVDAYCTAKHFSGGSPSHLPWQNYCFVLEIENDALVRDALYRQINDSRKRYRQDSVAWTAGTTLFC